MQAADTIIPQRNVGRGSYTGNRLTTTGGFRFPKICSRIEILEMPNFDGKTGKLRVPGNTTFPTGVLSSVRNIGVKREHRKLSGCRKTVCFRLSWKVAVPGILSVITCLSHNGDYDRVFHTSSR